MRYDIKTYGEEILRKKALKVEAIDEEILKLLDDMVETMEEAKGVGLAAPQIGVDKRIFVMDIGDGIIRKIINPELEYSEETEENEEGCLSVPGIYRGVKRSKSVKATYTNEKGETITEEAEGLLSRAFQHEYDHLEGVLFTDKVSPVSKRLISKKLQNLAKMVKK
ncbi:MAG: peptide deformylase [Fusobacteriaceae bacterium]